MSTLELVWLRYFLHLSFMLLVVSPRRPVALFRTRYPARQAGRSLLMLPMPLCWILAGSRIRYAAQGVTRVGIVLQSRVAHRELGAL